MASKGQKFNNYTPEFRNEIVLQYLNENKSYGYLANVLEFLRKQLKLGLENTNKVIR